MAHPRETNGPSPPVSPLRRAMNILTSRGLPSPELLRGIVLDENAVDMDEDESSSTTFLSPQPSPSGSRPSSRRNTGGSSPFASLRRMKDATVSLVRSKSSSDRNPAGLPKRQPTSAKRHGRSLSDVNPARQAATLTVKSLLFTPPGSPLSVNIQSPSRESPSKDPSDPLPALNIHLESFPLPQMPSATLSPVLDEDHTPATPVAHSAFTLDLTVPDVLQRGTPMTKVSGRKQTSVVFRLDPDQGQIIWESKRHRISACLCSDITI